MSENKTEYTPNQDISNEPPLPLLPDGQADLNELARQYREGERISKNIPIGDLLAAPGGYHNSHMVNPELHPTDPNDQVDLRAIQDAFKAARAKEATGDEKNAAPEN